MKTLIVLPRKLKEPACNEFQNFLEITNRNPNDYNNYKPNKIIHDFGSDQQIKIFF